jgi:hypothetical protein
MATVPEFWLMKRLEIIKDLLPKKTHVILVDNLEKVLALCHGASQAIHQTIDGTKQPPSV